MVVNRYLSQCPSRGSPSLSSRSLPRGCMDALLDCREVTVTGNVKGVIRPYHSKGRHPYSLSPAFHCCRASTKVSPCGSSWFPLSGVPFPRLVPSVGVIHVLTLSVRGSARWPCHGVIFDTTSPQSSILHAIEHVPHPPSLSPLSRLGASLCGLSAGKVHPLRGSHGHERYRFPTNMFRLK
jgi:hypothetical protein